MKRIAAVILYGLWWMSPPASAEILAMLNYESKPESALRELKQPVAGQVRREGLAVIDVDPASARYGEILMDIPLPPDLVAHHLFYNRDASKIYLTALGRPELRVIDMTRHPYRIKVIEIPDCLVGEDVVFSADNKTWYETCMGSQTLVVGDAVNDTYTRTIKLPLPYPHGIALHEGIDRILVTSTVRPSDLGDAGEAIAVLEASTGKTLSTHKVSDKPSPSGVAPVEIVFVPNTDPPVAYITNMYGDTLWTARWNPRRGDFDMAQAYDFSRENAGVPLELYFSDDGRWMYVTTAKPGHLHIFALDGDPTAPRLVKTLPADAGAHHVAFTKDGRYAYVQNSLLNLPGMSSGTVTVMDLQSQSVLTQIGTFRDSGFNPNSIVLLPEWDDHKGH